MANVQSAKLSLVEGQRRQAPPEMGQVSARRGTLYILVEVSAPTESWDQASRQIVSKAINTFSASRVGETVALQAAADAVNDMLLAQNKELPKEKHIWAGFNAAFIREDHLYLAQAGPALTYIARGNSVTRFPKSFDELQTSRMEALMPLGERPNIKCRLAHFRMEPLDMVTMAASHLPTLGNEAAIQDALLDDSAEDVSENLLRIAKHNDFSAYVIHYEPAEEATPAPSVTAGAEMEDEEWEEDEAWDDEEAWDDDEWEQEAVEEQDEWNAPTAPPPTPARPQATPRPAPPQHERTVSVNYRKSATPDADTPAAAGARQYRSSTPRNAEPARPTDQREQRARVQRAGATVHQESDDTASKKSTPREVGTADHLRSITDRGLEAMKAVDWKAQFRRVGAALLALGSALLGLLSALVLWWKQRVAPRAQSVAPALDGAAHSASRAGRRAWYATTDVLRGVLPGDHPAPPRDGTIPPPPGDGSSFLRAAAIALPLLIVFALLLLNWARPEGEATPGAGTGAGEVSTPIPAAGEAGGDYQTLMSQARDLLDQASNVDEGTAQSLALQADTLLTQAEPLATDSATQSEVIALRQRAQQILDRAGTIARPPTVTLATFGAEAQPAALLFGGDDLYLIESSRASVYRVLVDPQRTVSLEEIQPLLTAQEMLSTGVQMGTPQFISWVPAGNGRANDGLLILTQEGQLFDLEGQILKQSDFGVVASEGFQAAEGYGGNFYLLDPSNRQIWRYVPNAQGQYDGAPDAWLEETGQQQLGSPVDMAIDGFIFLLDQVGQVTRFQVGKPKSGFVLDPVTPALTAPVAMAKAPPESTDLFVADAQRVVRFDQNGRFLVEYRAPLGNDWGVIRDITVDPANEMLFVLSNSGVHMVDIRDTRRAPSE